MKKATKIIILLLIISLLVIVNQIVYATTKGTLKLENLSGVFYTMRGGSVGYLSAPFPYYSINDEVVYCVEPGRDITTTSYVGEDGIINLPYSDEINTKLKLIGHYGYEYPGHQTKKYRMATQALIWEITGNTIVEFWTQQYGYGDVISVNKEKQDIMTLVNNHTKKPSFDGITKETEINKEFILEDTKNVLNQYEIYDAGGNDVRIENNKLYITPKTVNKSSIILRKKHYDSKTTIFFKGTDNKSQKLGLLRNSDPVLTTINLTTTGGKVSIEKTDNDTGLNRPQGNATLKGAVYGIYDKDNNLLGKITTDEFGKGTSENINQLGDFTLKEISPPNGYLVDNNVYNFTLSSSNPTITLKVKEKVIKSELSIYKEYGSKSTNIMKAEPNITFDIFLKSTNIKVASITTNDKGIAKVSLPYGTYVVKQQNTTQDYEKVDDFEITINEDTPSIIDKKLSNYAIEGRLKVIKIDEETKKQVPIAGIKFKIKNLDTNEYVCQKDSISKESICEYVTNDEGVLITPYALVGNFQLEEVENQKIEGYLWNKNKIKSHIGDNTIFEEDPKYGKLYAIKFPNTRVKGKIEINKKGEKIVFTNNTFSYEKIPLKGAKFGLYANEDIKANNQIIYQKNKLIKEVITDNKGFAKIENLELGKYYLLEISTDNNHILEQKKYEFELKYKDQYTGIITETLNIDNYYKKGTLEFTKTDLTTGEVIPNTLIEIYTEDDKLVFRGTTNEEGKITINNLFVGKFYIIEIEPNEGYALNEDKVYFQILENGEIVKAEMTNKKITGTLEFTKVDFSTDEPLPDTKIEIYNIKDELIYSGITDERGKIIVKELEYGKYYIIEKEAPIGYQLNPEKIYFEILEDGEIVKCKMQDEIIIEVPNTDKTDYHIELIIGLLFVAFGSCLILYGKKNGKKKIK